MSTDPFDRMVHGVAPDGGHIVRYDRSGKWYVEYLKGADGTTRKRRLVTVTQAAELAVAGKVHLGLAGGLTFDARVRKLQKTSSTPKA